MSLRLKGLVLYSSIIFSSIANASVVSSNGGLLVKDGEHWFKLEGLFHLDQIFFFGSHHDKYNSSNVAQPFGNSANIRRARAGFSGGLGNNLSYKLMVNLNSGSRTVSVIDGYVTYHGWDNSKLSLGQIKPVYGLTNSGPRNDLPFLEMSLPSVALGMPDYSLGFLYQYQWQMVTLAASVFEPGTNIPASYLGTGHKSKADPLGVALRATVAPLHESTRNFHLGLSLWYQKYNSFNEFGNPANKGIVRTSPEIRGRSDDGSFGAYIDESINASRNITFSVEGGLTLGPWHSRAEFTRSQFQYEDPLVGNSDPRPYGWYVTLGYMLTGESRTYDYSNGTYGNPIPESYCGAWEILARYSRLNADSHAMNGGREINYSFGLNWFINERFRFAVNYIHARYSPHETSLAPNKKILDILGVRAQFAL